MSSGPTHKVLAVTSREDGNQTRQFYTKVGVAFPIKDGAGLSLVLDALPTNGKLLVLEFNDEDSEKKPEKKKAK